MAILLIEDDPWLADTFMSGLSEYEIILAANGQAALDAMDEHVIDLIVADVMLPHGTVIDVLHHLQSYSDSMTIPVIVCSSLAGNMSLEDLGAYGVVTLLDKTTLTPTILRGAVQQALHDKGEDRG